MFGVSLSFENLNLVLNLRTINNQLWTYYTIYISINKLGTYIYINNIIYFTKAV